MAEDYEVLMTLDECNREECDAAKAELADVRTALERIKREYGKVCAEYETCDHVACQKAVTPHGRSLTALYMAKRPSQPIHGH